MLAKNFYLISFLPALGYWFLEAYYPLQVALVCSLGLALLELLFEKIFAKSLHALSKFNFFLILGLGLVSLLGEDGIWFKLSPGISGLVIGLYLVIRMRKGKGIFLEMMESMQKKIAFPWVLNTLERDLSLFFISYGLFMIIMAVFFSSNVWIFFKTAGMYLIFGLFLIVEMLLIRRKVKNFLLQNKRKF